MDNDESGEEIIELTDIVMDEPDFGLDDTIIELTDIAENPGMDLNLDIVKVDADEGIEDFDLGLESEEKPEPAPKDPGPDPESALSFAPTLEQVEAALEKVIEKQFADKIETILFQVIEKVIEREITGIRESLQKDLDQIENA
nr:hypothetical protein [Desulfobacula sp.]